jgi:putative aldouronate transport system substrate-binding protein
MVILGLDRGASVFQAVRQGAFWEIGPYLKDYPNLSQAPDVVLWNSSFDGKTYGLYRGRPLGRNGVIYRSDWLANLGMSVPKTIDDFYKMLYAFTYNDPDKNGKKDTYGMVMTQYMGPFDNVLTWFGGPNGWGFDGAGGVIPAFLTPEYKETLKFFKKLYDEKIINEDFAVFSPNNWNNPLIAGEAGCAIDVTDRSNKINIEFERSVPGAKMDIMSPPAGPKGQRSMATAGFAGVFLFSKQAIKDEATLKKVLAFFDKLGDKKMLDLCGYGIEGRHYDLVDGFIQPKPVGDPSFKANEINDMNQILPFIPNAVGTPLYQKWWISKGAEVQKFNEKIVVGNPVAPFTSATFATKGASLDNLVNDARIKYIVGQIDDKGWDEMVATWKKTGGDDVIREYNEQYKKYAKK